MVYYYEPIYHVNTSDNEEVAVKLYSSKEEPKTIVSVIFLDWNNEGIVRLYREREKLGEIPTGTTKTQLPLGIPVELEIPEGQEFKITLQNRVSGTNAKIVGYIQYLIK
jgi:hypothetical protein